MFLTPSPAGGTNSRPPIFLTYYQFQDIISGGGSGSAYLHLIHQRDKSEAKNAAESSSSERTDRLCSKLISRFNSINSYMPNTMVSFSHFRAKPTATENIGPSLS